MGLMLSAAKRSANKFNIEERAHRVISREKPVPAPKHAKDKEVFQRVLENDPQSLTELLKKDSQHDERLKQVYLESFDLEVNKKKDKPDTLRPLPSDRKSSEVTEFGFHNPTKVPYGKCSLEQALEFMKDHSIDKEKHNVKEIAAKYKLNEELTGNILNHFRIFKVYLPPKVKAKTGNLLMTAEEAARTKQLTDS